MRVWVVHKGWSVYGVYRDEESAIKKRRSLEKQFRKESWDLDTNVHVSRAEVE